MEHQYSRYTREKAWAALYSQHINAGYALVPHSATNNSIDALRCKSPSEVKTTMLEFLEHDKEIERYYASENEKVKKSLQSLLRSARYRTEEYRRFYVKPYGKAVTAAVLSKSSDYHHYHLSDYPNIQLVICGLHDSYLQYRVWELRTNGIYDQRATMKPIHSLVLKPGHTTEHNILVGALICGDVAAIAYRDNSNNMSRWTRNRIIQEVNTLQTKNYQGRPLAFLNEAERKEIGQKISLSLIQYHAARRA